MYILTVFAHIAHLSQLNRVTQAPLLRQVMPYLRVTVQLTEQQLDLASLLSRVLRYTQEQLKCEFE